MSCDDFKLNGEKISLISKSFTISEDVVKTLYDDFILMNNRDKVIVNMS